jgi:hypothetical protein
VKISSVQTISREGFSLITEEPSETTRQTPEVTEAYLLGALHDGTYSKLRKTHRFSQANIEWLKFLQDCLADLGHKAWLYKEGKTRNVYVFIYKL